MTSHRSIMTNLATAIQASTDVANYCYRHFGRALAINVGAYANGIPDENDSPFLWIHAADVAPHPVACEPFRAGQNRHREVEPRDCSMVSAVEKHRC